MFMDQFEKWDKVDGSKHDYEMEDRFSIFYQQQMAGKSFFEMLYELAYQMYEMQVCIEGLLEDQDGQENQKA